ncbi:MAG: enolase C-terminal domain-like protein [Spirochaetota bacterium]
MKKPQIRVHALTIPFKLEFTHSQAKRLASDSLIVEIAADGITGFGEAVAREYVTGTNASAAGEISGTVASIYEKLNHSDISSLADISGNLLSPDWPAAELPLLCAVEAALLDIFCRQQEVDVYTLLGREPQRNELRYGGTLPMLPPEAAEKMLGAYTQAGIGNLRIKLSRNSEYNRTVLQTARRILGDDYDIRVDANAAWSVEETLEQLKLIKDYGISLVEEPLGRRPEEMCRLAGAPESDGICYVADESAVTFQDLDQIAADGTFGMINIRLSKHGGLLRSLKMAATAESYGLRYQLGCHVGETGILSALGRVAASLMSDPVYIDGSYDRHLLAQNIITEDYSFGYGGIAGVRRGQGPGYIVDRSKLEKVSSEVYTCT